MCSSVRLVVALASVFAVVSGRASLRNNGYEELTISLDEPDSIKPKECGQIVDNLKVSSSFLFYFVFVFFRLSDGGYASVTIISKAIPRAANAPPRSFGANLAMPCQTLLGKPIGSEVNRVRLLT